MKDISKFIWAVFFVLVLPLAAYTAYSGFVIGEMVLPGGFEFVFREKYKGTTNEEKIDELSDEELQKRQIELEQRFQELEQKASQPEGSEIPQQPQSINLSGIWYGQNGLSYQISQDGDFVTIQEMNPLYGVTAVGQGSVQGESVVIDYQTASYTQGVANLTMSPEGRSLNGTFRDNYTGYTVPVTLNR